MDHLLKMVKEFKILEKQVILKYLYRNELDKACFAHDAGYSDSKDLIKRTTSNKILKDRAYEIARNCDYHGYQRALASMVYKFFDKKTGSGVSVNEQLAEELHKPVIKKFKRRKLNVRFLRTTFVFFCSTRCMVPLTSKRNSFQNNNKKSHIQFCWQTSDF